MVLVLVKNTTFCSQVGNVNFYTPCIICACMYVKIVLSLRPIFWPVAFSFLVHVTKIFRIAITLRWKHCKLCWKCRH